MGGTSELLYQVSGPSPYATLPRTVRLDLDPGCNPEP